mgnify:CR=1 FL=1
MEKEKVKVVFRKSGNGNEEEIIAFFPEEPACYGNISYCTYNEGSGEASYAFYLSTRKAEENEYRPLLEKLKASNDSLEFIVKEGIYYPDLQKTWVI